MFSPSFCTIPKKQQLKTSPFVLRRLQFCTTSRWQISPKYWYSPLVSLNLWIMNSRGKTFHRWLDMVDWHFGWMGTNRFVNKWTISRLQASFLNQGKHNLVFHFFNWKKTLLRLIGIYLSFSFNRKVSGISAHDFVSPSIQDLSF